jgi:hypothetical protein
MPRPISEEGRRHAQVQEHPGRAAQKDPDGCAETTAQAQAQAVAHQTATATISTAVDGSNTRSAPLPAVPEPASDRLGPVTPVASEDGPSSGGACALSLLNLPAGLARGLLAAWQIRSAR